MRRASCLLLLCVGLDLGVHGLCASDFRPFPVSASTIGGAPEGHQAAGRSHDHCFCNSQLLGATPSLPDVRLEQTRDPVPLPRSETPCSSARPLDHPPRLSS